MSSGQTRQYVIVPLGIIIPNLYSPECRVGFLILVHKVASWKDLKKKILIAENNWFSILDSMTEKMEDFLCSFYLGS